MIGLGATQGFSQAPAADEGFHSGDNAKVRIGLRIFACLVLAAELLHVCHGLGAPLDETIRLGEEFVFNADRGDVALLQFSDQPLHVIEVAVSCVAIEENRNRGRIGHEFQHLKHLGPAGFVVVTDSKLGGDGEAACPNASKAGFLNDF
jgi:hypothetical protein